MSAILPLLKEIFGESQSELALKLTALQIIVPLQVMLLNPQSYRQTLGVDIIDVSKSLELMDTLIDNAIGSMHSKEV